jgi:hypothetical protein
MGESPFRNEENFNCHSQVKIKSMKRFVIIIYTVKGSDQNIKEVMKNIGEWISYFPNSWLVHTSLSPEEIYKRIGTNVAGDRFLILEVNLKDYYGILPNEAWAWLKSRKDEQTHL